MPLGSVILYSLRKKRVPKQCPWGTIATNSTLFLEGHFFSLIIMFTVLVPQGIRGTIFNLFLCENSTPVLMGHRNSTPRSTKLRTAK